MKYHKLRGEISKILLRRLIICGFAVLLIVGSYLGISAGFSNARKDVLLTSGYSESDVCFTDTSFTIHNKRVCYRVTLSRRGAVHTYYVDFSTGAVTKD